MTDEALPGGRFAAPRRDDDTATRNAGASAANIHALLDHLEARGFSLSPRVLGVSDNSGREQLSFLPSTAGHPPLPAAIRSEIAPRSAARAVRQLHDAGEGFTPPDPGGWDRQEITVPAEIDCIGHGDLAPWNLIFDATR